MKFKRLTIVLFKLSIILMVQRTGVADPSTLAAQLRASNIRSQNTISIAQYLRPNELTPGDAAPIYASLEPGAHFYVGTERGFIGLGLSPNASVGILIDVNERVTKYNLINILLLRISTNQSDYFELRHFSTPEIWLQRAKELNFSAQEIEIFSDKEAIRAWNKVNYDYTESEIAVDPRELQREGGTNQIVPFDKANYLHYPEQFERVQKMAKEGRIVALNIDLRDEASWREIIKRFIGNSERVALIDISNAWEESYIGFEQLNALRKRLLPVSEEGAKIIVSKLRDKNSIRMWSYEAFLLNQSEHEFASRFKKSTAGCSALAANFAI